MEVAARHEEQINGDRGLSKAIEALRAEMVKSRDALSEEMANLRRVLWTVGGGVVLSAIGFALAVLRATG